MAVIDGKRASRPGRAGADVAYHCTRDVQAAMSPKTQTEGQVDVFEVTEERLVEATDIVEGVAAHERCCGAR